MLQEDEIDRSVRWYLEPRESFQPSIPDGFLVVDLSLLSPLSLLSLLSPRYRWSWWKAGLRRREKARVDQKGVDAE
jgi:hypothetical protein